MKKNFLLFICVLLCAALLAAVLTACNDEDGTQTVKPGGEGQTGEELPDGGLVFELASNGESYAVTDYSGISTEVVIPSVHEGLPVTSIERNAFSGHSDLTAITIPDSVTGIYPRVFIYCTNIKTANIPTHAIDDIPQDSLLTVTLTGEGAIEDSAFRECATLTTVTINDDVSKIGSSAFYRCDNLTSVSIGDGVTSIGWGAFDNCSKLTSVTIGNGVTSIGDRAFFWCHDLTTVTIGEGVKSIGEDAFLDCESLTSITLPDRVESIGDSAFSECSGLTSIAIPNSVTHIGSYAFSGCTAEIVWGDDPEITTIGNYAFCGYDGTSISIPDGVTSIEAGAFSDCHDFTSIVIPDSVISIGASAFNFCHNLTYVALGRGVSAIGNNAFRYCDKLVEVYDRSDLGLRIGGSLPGELGYYVKHIYTEEGDSWFTDTDDGFRFFYDGEQGYLMGYYGSETEITLPASFTAYDGTAVESYVIYDHAFYDRGNLTAIAIPDSVTGIEDEAFHLCSKLKSIVIPKSVTSIGFSVLYRCSDLTSIVVEEGNPVYHSAGNCLIETATGTLIQGCNNSVIPCDGSVTSIENSAFSRCDGLTSVTIPKEVTYIGYSAFGQCYSLASVTFEGTVEEWNAIDKRQSWLDPNCPVAKIVCSDGTVSVEKE